MEDWARGNLHDHVESAAQLLLDLGCRVHVCIDMCVGMDIGMGVDICVGMCVDMYADMHAFRDSFGDGAAHLVDVGLHVQTWVDM